MTLDACRKWLLGIWGTGFLIPFLLILFQSGGGKYGMKVDPVLGWLTALTLPTILLMIGVMVGNPTSEKSEDKKKEDKKAVAEAGGDEGDGNANSGSKTAHETFIFRITAAASLAYLLIVNLVFFLEPYSESTPHDLMGKSKIFLAVIDSVISLLIGYFFGKK